MKNIVEMITAENISEASKISLDDSVEEIHARLSAVPFGQILMTMGDLPAFGTYGSGLHIGFHLGQMSMKDEKNEKTNG